MPHAVYVRADLYDALAESVPERLHVNDAMIERVAEYMAYADEVRWAYACETTRQTYRRAAGELLRGQST